MRVHSMCGEPLGDLSDGFGTQFESRVHWVCWGAEWGWGTSEAMRQMTESGLEQLLVVLLEGCGPSRREGFSEMSAAVVVGVWEDVKGEETLTQWRREEPVWWTAGKGCAGTAGRGPLGQC